MNTAMTSPCSSAPSELICNGFNHDQLNG